MRKKVLILLLLLTCLFIASRILTFKKDILEQTLSYITYPIVMFQYKVLRPIHRWKEYKKVEAELFERYQKLYEHERKLFEENIMLTSLLDTQNYFYELIDHRQRYNSHYMIPVHVIFKHIDTNSHYYLIDKGSSAGITQDMIAVIHNCLIGRVTQVYPWYSKVTLITDSSSKVPAWCAYCQAQGILEGTQSTQKLSLKFVSHLEELFPDDMVLSRGEGLVYPKGFALGHIESYEKNGLHYTINVKPLFDFTTIHYCYIIQPGAEYCELL